MRLSANIIQSAEQRTNPLGEREIILRSMAIPTIEHLSVTRDQFDSIDLSNNHLVRLDNFPKLERLASLYLGGNGIEHVDGKNLKRNCPRLTSVVLTGNGIKGWNVIADLGEGCPRLEFLSLIGNPITRRQNYRLYVINKIPSLKVLDFQKVKQAERERAKRLAASAAGAAMESDARMEARTTASLSVPAENSADAEAKSFEPGEGKNASETFATQFSAEEKAKIREMVANAASADEIDRIETMVKQGVFPGRVTPPPPEAKRAADGEEGEANKRERQE